MTPQRAKELLPVIQAFADGKTIQYAGESTGFTVWHDEDDFSPQCGADGSIRYRIKPEKKWRAWKPEEVPVGALIRSKGQLVKKALIMSVGDEYVATTRNAVISKESFSSLLEEAEHSTDGGKTWHPCGIEE